MIRKIGYDVRYGKELIFFETLRNLTAALARDSRPDQMFVASNVKFVMVCAHNYGNGVVVCQE